MSYPVGTSFPNPAVYPGFAPAPNPLAGIPMYSAPILGRDAYQPSNLPYPALPPAAPAQPQSGIMSLIGAFGGIFATILGFFRHARPQQAPQPAANPYAGQVLPDRTQQSDEDFVTGLYGSLLGRQPDPDGFAGYVTALRNGVDRHDVLRGFMESPEYRARQQLLGQPQPAPAPAPPAPVTTEDVKNAARQYVASHPEIANEPSYVNEAAVAQLRDGVIAMLVSQGYRAGRILGPDGAPYPQMVAFGNSSDVDAKAYRVTAGGAAIREAINAGYCNDNIPWSDVH